MKKTEKYLMAALLLGVAAQMGAVVYRQKLDGGWKFRDSRKVEWHEAEVPGVVHTDLLRHGMIPDPFEGENERAVQWVDKEDWIYETVFDLDDSLASHDYITLAFDGLDTYADVFLNDSLVLKADNMFRQWRVPVKGIVKEKGNCLSVYFHSPIKIDMPKFEALPFRYDAVNDQSQNGGIFDKRLSMFARKAGYHYGWDWGPRLVTSGIWRPVYIEAWSGPVIDDVFFSTKEIGDNKAEMSATISIFSDIARKVKIEIADRADQKKLKTADVVLKKGENKIQVPFTVGNPRLWWCNGLGEPNLYDFSVTLSAGGKMFDTVARKTGIRKIEVVRDEDKDGRSFYFRLNGKPLFVKGANYIPNDNFLTRVTAETYRRTVRDAVDANMNMLRVWGGGIYENDLFYELCDSLGVMVWQDFMFACSLYPAEGEMLENIEAEARDNIRRLRNHPSIALWCGNNECLEAWYTWGLKERYEKEGYGDVIWKQYDNLFHHLLPAVLAEEDSGTFYWPSSPFSREDGASENNRGDTHLWSVWGNGAPIETYNKVRSRFFSEYGFQSFPEYSTVLRYAPDTVSHFIDSDVMLAHQRAGEGANRKMETYMLQHFSEPKDFRSSLYLSQVLQADAVTMAIEAHRRDKPYCMGTMFWQINDCWPVASWSSRDYYGNWKGVHYRSREAYRDILVSAIENGNDLDIHIVSDRQKPTEGILTLTTFALEGQEIKRTEYKTAVKANVSEVVSISREKILSGYAPEDVVAHISFVPAAGSDCYENVYTFVPAKDLNLRQPQISVSLDSQNGENVLTLKSDKYVKALCIELEEPAECSFSNNYFDMLPGREYRVTITSGVPAQEILKGLRLTHVFSATNR